MVLISCDVIQLVWTAPSMVLLHSLGHDQNEVQYDIFGHVMSLGPVLEKCDADSVVNGTIAFLRARQLK